MSKKQKRVFWPGLALVAIAIITFALVEGRTRRVSNAVITSVQIERGSSTTAQDQGAQAPGATTKNLAHRNLSLQPEAFNLGRRLGQRFAPGKREQSILLGTLTIGAERRIVQTTRKQTDDGEQIEIRVTGSSGSLSWDRVQGAMSSGARATGGDRDLIERLLLDSPDQFVLAQLRGASYYTIARNVRPEGVADNYRGPLWNIVRVDDPERDESKRPQSRWRLYYINATTGLIDKVVSEIQGQKIVAEVSNWIDLNGEQVSAQINWTRQGQMIMQYRLTNFSHAEAR